VQRALCAAIIAVGIAASTPTAAHSNYSTTVFIDDSLTDSGYFEKFLGGYFQKSRTTNPDPMWAEILGDRLGSNDGPAWYLDTITGRVALAGNNFAAGGARLEEQG
jgi:outer membrane lipase/esterase